MNSLSWMLYAADAVGGIAFVVSALGLFAFTYGMWMYVFSYTRPDREERHVYSSREDDFESRRAERVAYRPVAKRILFAGITGMVAGALLPSSSTVYLIAASEAGETIVTSPEAKEVFDDLKTIIKSKLKDQLPKV